MIYNIIRERKSNFEAAGFYQDNMKLTLSGIIEISLSTLKQANFTFVEK